MSDGALSQDEIDALLAGVDSSNFGGMPSTIVAPGGGTDVDLAALEKFFSSNTGALSSNLSTLTGTTVSLRGPQVTFMGRDGFLSQLPETVTVITANFTSGFPGEHLFILSEETAKSIASLMTKEDNIQLDDMAMSVIGEVVSQMVGTQITALTDKTGNKSIANASPSAANIPKAAAALPSGDFAIMTYQLYLGDGDYQPLWEIVGQTPATDISRSLGGASPASMGLGDMQIPGLSGGMGGLQMPSMGSGMSMPGMSHLGPSNVQSVQFPNLSTHRLGPQEAGNIGLIMDVSMEMTVELGRTRKLIKEILGMGEGTIIELDKLAGEPVDILVNHKLIAKGEVVVIDENFGVRVTEIVSPMDRINEMG
ncbi:MAG: flagellar motor switch protein FliN [Treponema sp.]|nr:flagellar motor switch protein FliN [Treponema sp.]